MALTLTFLPNAANRLVVRFGNTGKKTSQGQRVLSGKISFVLHIETCLHGLTIAPNQREASTGPVDRFVDLFWRTSGCEVGLSSQSFFK